MDTLFALLDTSTKNTLPSPSDKEKSKESVPNNIRKTESKNDGDDNNSSSSSSSSSRKSNKKEKKKDDNKEKRKKKGQRKRKREEVEGIDSDHDNNNNNTLLMMKKKKKEINDDDDGSGAEFDVMENVRILLRKRDSVGASATWLKWFANAGKHDNDDDGSGGGSVDNSMIQSLIELLNQLNMWSRKRMKKNMGRRKINDGNDDNGNKRKSENDDIDTAENDGNRDNGSGNVLGHGQFIARCCALLTVVVGDLVPVIQDEQRAHINPLCNKLLLKCMGFTLDGKDRKHGRALIQVFDTITRHPESVFPRDIDVYSAWISYNLKIFRDEQLALSVAIQFNDHQSQLPVEHTRHSIDANVFNAHLKKVASDAVRQIVNMRKVAGMRRGKNKASDDGKEEKDRARRSDKFSNRRKEIDIREQVEKLFDAMRSFSRRNDPARSFIDSTSVAIYLDYLYQTRIHIDNMVQKLCNLRLELGIFTVNNVKILNSVANHLVKTDRVDLAHELITQTEKTAAGLQSQDDAGQHVEPDVASYSILMNGYAEKKDADGAESVLKHMRERHVSPNLYTYNVLTKLYHLLGLQEKVNEVALAIKNENLVEERSVQKDTSKKKTKDKSKKKTAGKKGRTRQQKPGGSISKSADQQE